MNDTTMAMAENELDELDVLMAELGDIEDDAGEEELDLAELESAVAEIEVAEAKIEAYASIEPDVEASKAPKAAETKKPKQKRIPRTEGAARGETFAAMVADILLLVKTDASLKGEALKARQEEVKTIIDGLNVKVGAKAENLLRWSAGLSGLSIFLNIGIRYALTNKVVTSAGLTEHFQDEKANGIKSYGRGTATPQATNIIAVFKALQVIVPTDGGYTVNDDSLIAERGRSTFGL